MSSVLHTPQQAVDWLHLRGAGALHADSRRVRRGDAFLAWPGASTDARRFVPQLLAAGASACLIEQQGSADLGLDLEDVRLARYSGLKAHAGPIAATFYRQPSAAMPVLAVTGTNGKTTTAWWLAQALAGAGRRCAVVGTLGIGEPGSMAISGLTTPDPVLLQGELRRLADEGCVACTLEASSIGLAEARLAGLAIDTAIFTNFTQDHLDYHGSMDAYWQAKAQLFDWPGLRAAVINVDDPRGAELAGQLAQRTGLQVWTLSCRADARLRARHIRAEDGAMVFDLQEGQRTARLRVPACGDYNVGNLLGVVGALRSLGLTLEQATAACAHIAPVPGRMESFGEKGQPLAVVDYAHTPDALEQALLALRPLAAARGGQLWVVFGCGGDRDRLKRPLMAAAAQRCADRLVLTSDNPRSEPAQAIVQEMLAGLPSQDHALVQTDRALAIEQALQQASDADVVLVAGKGHEDYQELAGQRLPFSDRQQVQRALAARRSAKAGPT